MLKSDKKDDFAVIKAGGKQYLVDIGDEILVDRIKGKKGETAKKGLKLNLGTLLINKKGSLKIGNPMLKTGQARGEVIEEIKDEKIVVFKYRPKKRYRKKTGFRAKKTKIKILSI
ncbi:MAG: 50S ribosomal protein L21 [Candidatus Berkelbacteria bacterium]|nr:50S ribosomal protein L21 [Candidatus Berkelbacteria bacterium]